MVDVKTNEQNTFVKRVGDDMLAEVSQTYPERKRQKTRLPLV